MHPAAVVADMQAGRVADLDCFDNHGNVVFAVEVKDRKVELHDLQEKLPSIRQRGVSDALILTRSSISERERSKHAALLEQQFVAGHNLYIADFATFSAACLILLREPGRRDFLKAIGAVLDENRVGLEHRQHWQQLLQQH